MKKTLQLSIIILLSGCFKNIDIYDDEIFEPVLIVNSIVGPDAPFIVQVSKTSVPKQLDSSVFVLDAKVQVFENDQLLGTLSLSGWIFGKVYMSDFDAKEGHTYTIKVEALDKTIKKEVALPEKVSSVNISFSDTLLDIYSSENSFVNFSCDSKLNITIDDPSGKNYYMFDFYSYSYGFLYDEINDIVTDSILETHKEYYSIYFKEEFTDIQYVQGRIPYLFSYEDSPILNDDIFSEQSFTFQPNLWFGGTINPSEENELVLYYRVFTISEDLFNYYVTVDKAQRAEGNPFVEPVNIYSNIENSYGIITGFNYHLDSIIIPLNF